MRATLFTQELKQYRTSFLIWSLTIVALIAMTMAAMPTMLSNTANLRALLKAYPEGFMRAFSFNLSTFEDPLGFYVVYGTLYVALLGGIFSSFVAAGIVSKEQGQGTAEFLLAKPLTRTQVSLTKIAAYLALVLGLNILTFFTAWLCLKAFSPLPFRVDGLLILSFYALLLALSMGGIGLLLSLLVRRARSFTGPAIGIVIGFYLLDAVAKITEKYDAFGWISPFKWMDVRVTEPGYGLSWWRMLLFAALIVGSFTASVVLYNNKDILS
ncbi:MAG: ABC transporter permease subunit [Spirochaetia bacterium]